jgi:hypothetical protein
MTKRNPRGGEPDAARLLDLARAELLNEILPNLDGDARYRARLIANALKIAAHELESGAAGAAATARDLAALSGTGSPASLREALRAGTLDGDPDLHALLVRLTDRRRAVLG